MCCFCLHFSDFIVLFFKKNKKLTSEKNNLLCKKREKITCREKSQTLPPPAGYQMVRPLLGLLLEFNMISPDVH